MARVEIVVKIYNDGEAVITQEVKAGITTMNNRVDKRDIAYVVSHCVDAVWKTTTDCTISEFTEIVMSKLQLSQWKKEN